MGRQLARNVYVDGQWYRPGDTPPDHVAEQITNPACWSDDDGGDGEAEAGEILADLAIPARSGPGSGKQAWWEYAERNGVTVPDDPSRDDIIAACEAAGVPTE